MKRNARKHWTCEDCGVDIKPGDIYYHESGKGPVFDDDEMQIGIEYWSFRHCIDADLCEDRSIKQNKINNAE